MRLALYQPDIPQNAGALIRLGACLGVGIDLIEPLGFILDDRRLKRAHMDYLEHLRITRHGSWEQFLVTKEPGRLVLLTTRGDSRYTDFRFKSDDILLLGRESAGVPEEVHRRAAARVRVPLRPGLRSLNVAIAAAMVLGEALRQTEEFPP
jgi:tRNA (cytidine/uridine-2'-O-)-methyltransferase